MTAPVPILAGAMRRARKDPIARLLAGATALGVRFRFSGPVLQIANVAALHPDDQAVLRRYLEDIRARLEPVVPETDPLEALEVEGELITDPDRAAEVLAGLDPAGAYGLDCETTPDAPGSGPAGWLRITKSGCRAVHQPRDPDRAALDPLGARPRLVALYAPADGVVFLFDMHALPWSALRPLENLQVYIHNAAFDVAMLLVRGIRLRRVADTLQLARLTYGAERGGLRLADLAEPVLGVELDKTEQRSDWGAEHLSEHQLRYAAADAVAAQRIGVALWRNLDPEARAAYRAGAAAVAPAVAMRLAGVPFDRSIHGETIAAWERAYAVAYHEFRELTGCEPPAQGPARSAWLEARMPPELLAWWPRTETGLLRAGRADLSRLAAVPEVRPLLAILWAQKRLTAFGYGLLARIGPDGRLHMDLKPAATKTGRCSCSHPALQQLPEDVRQAVVAPAGRLLVIADLSQIELRCAAELSGDEVMRAAFADGRDLHRLTAAAIAGIDEEEVTPEQRTKAKRASFGVLYGSGPDGLVASTWEAHKLEMTSEAAQRHIDLFYAFYPRLRVWQLETYEQARATGGSRSRLGRPLRSTWEGGRLRWQLCCNYPVQASAADLMLRAMARVHRGLARRDDARLLLAVHDELVLEADEAAAAEIEQLLEAEMTAAYRELFPDAPVLGLVHVASRRCWAKPPNP